MRDGLGAPLATSLGLLLCGALVLWVRLMPLDPSGVDADHKYVGADGAEHVYLGDLDSYLWLRHARLLLQTGDACDAVVDGACRDLHTTAPVGARTTYARSLHPAAIASLHRLLARWSPERPLPATAALVPVVVGVLGVLPAFAIGRMLGGVVAGVFAVALTMLEPMVLGRTIGGDNDVWNVVLPISTLWLVLLGLRAARTGARVAWAGLAGLCVGLNAWAWSGWMLFHVVIAAGLAGTVLLDVVGRRAFRMRDSPAAVVLAAFVVAAAAATSVTPEGGYLQLPRALLGVFVPGTAAPAEALAWPTAFATVDELRRLDLRAIVRLVGGGAVVAGGGLGIAMLCFAGGIARAAGIILGLWLAAAAYVASGGVRFLLLLTPALGIACAVAVGRMTSALRREIRSAGAWYRATATTVLVGVLGLALARAVEPGWTLAAGYRPAMNDAWSRTLEHLRATTPPDAIVHTWWDFGHWTTYGADRRVSNDGSSLRTHVPYWTSRALLTSNEAESAGILRMLSCASDALPLPEGDRGAYATLRRTGRDPLAAFAIVGGLVEREAAAADAYLAERGFAPSEREDVLRATHCAPPASYLVVTTRLLDVRTALVDIGSWQPSAPPTNGTDQSGTPFLREWVACDAPGADGARTCPIAATIAAGTVRLASVAYRPDAAGSAVLVAGRGDGPLATGAPSVVLVAGADGIERAVSASPTHPDLGVLVDVERGRVLVGAPVFLESTLVRLLYLDGRYTRRYAKVDDQVAAGERVTTWRIDWPDGP